MFQLINRISWVISIWLWISIASIDKSLIIWWIIIALATKYILLSPEYIKSRLQFFKMQILAWKKKSQWSIALHQNSSEIIEKTSQEERIVENNKENINYVAHEQSDYASKQANKISDHSFIQQFFSENLLAKFGWILVFLGVLFLLSLIYTVIGPVAKILTWFAIGFSLFVAGMWLDKKWFTNESRIVMGVAILINYLVILSGRYILWDDSSSNGTLLSVTMTFWFLILNTLFAIMTALLYNSRPLLIFAFAFAYVNPLLLGESSSEPYTLLGYTMIVTLWAMYMSYTRKDSILFPFTFILASIMFLIAPWNDGNGWIVKLLCINTLGTMSLYISNIFKKSFQYISEFLIGGIFFLIGFMWLLGIQELSSTQMIILWTSSLTLMAFCYFSMHKWGYLYSIWTLGTILTISPAIYTNGLQKWILWISILIIITFGIMNIGIILSKTKELLANNLSNIIFGLLSWAMFLTYMIYFFGNIHFPGMIQWFAFFGLAIVYFSLAFFIVSKIWIDVVKTNEKYENIFYTITAIGLSLFSLSVAFVFAENKDIISIIWFLEANVLFFLMSKIKSIKVALVGIVLFIIGVIKFSDFIDIWIFWESSFSWEYGMLISLGIILASLVINLLLIFRKNTPFLHISFYGIHNFFHCIAMILIVFTSYIILNISWNWESLLYFSIIVTLLWVLYDKINAAGLKNTHLVVYIILMTIHIILFISDLWRERLNLIISTLIIGTYTLPFIYDYISQKKIKSIQLFIIFLWYIFILSTLYISHIFQETFTITLYWGILSFILLSYGIRKDILPLRTLGLYLVVLTAGKVFFYDIWMSVDDTISRVIALIITGILMIILSTMYTRKYGNSLNSEFNISNIRDKI